MAGSCVGVVSGSEYVAKHEGVCVCGKKVIFYIEGPEGVETKVVLWRQQAC